MDDHVNLVDPVEEYENENSIGISHVDPISDDGGDTTNTDAPNTVSTEDQTEVQTYGLGEIREIVDCVRDGIKYLFKEVFPRYGDRDSSFEWVPTVEEWGQVENVCQLLVIFNEITNIVSGSDYPTTNLFLSEVWRMKDILGKKSRDENEYMKSMVRKMTAKFDKYWGECNLLMAIAAVLDPRFKMVLIQFCFPLIYQESDASKNIDYVSQVLHELYDEYVHEYNSTLEAQREQENARINVSSCSSSVGRNMQSGQSLFKSFVRSVDTVQPSKSELDNYLEESIYICEEGSDASFDALEWWKANSLKFRTLSKLARDILATPITTVSSESTFSAGGRVIDPHRASLSTEIVQMLLCGSDWVRALYGLKRSSTNSLSVLVVLLILLIFDSIVLVVTVAEWLVTA
ncbi:hypothetical protein F2P56_008924 [Juglans regia]|uniref:Zinc finger BED domain-containing protein RICESLEEPER 2-like n=2 Tax=Juglans regia TaxID=51240 RepID=A0A833XMN1_JUGRE|nr:zinc finger BED domain-containing protein RICESLEEPER 2-like [Juglans regia]KAF5472187.1 hypothetical protein F2P56_008924 [Juglans regia]